MQNHQENSQKSASGIKHRVITMLNRQEMDFLDKIGKNALFSTGHKLSYNEVLRALVDFAMEAKLSGEKAHSMQELKEEMWKHIEEKLKFRIGGLKEGAK